ncbi:GNAT family N-acetyltransferase [Pseudalkalibacillus decolorationis]|uniref:GNAT family N-acetyltransferase n=1 Tax=Pseudalkalibacillus decolorationis TaxID=163879 RepID=UPI002149308A|nr:GNAT family protein [Pseudalkalibacillus decolorationis]
MFIFPIDKDLSLKLLEKRDIPELFALVDGSRMYLRKWLPWVDGMEKEEDYEPVIEMWLKQFAEQNGFQVGVLYKDSLVGMIGYHGIDTGNQKTSIGYWLAEGIQGKGIMTRSTKALVNYAFDTLHLNRVEIQCGVENSRSRGIPERLGFKNEGIIREAEYLYDHFHDCVIYSMLRKEWSNR